MPSVAFLDHLQVDVSVVEVDLGQHALVLNPAAYAARLAFLAEHLVAENLLRFRSEILAGLRRIDVLHADAVLGLVEEDSNRVAIGDADNFSGEGLRWAGLAGVLEEHDPTDEDAGERGGDAAFHVWAPWRSFLREGAPCLSGRMPKVRRATKAQTIVPRKTPRRKLV